PDHSTISRRGETLPVSRPRVGSEAVHLLVDSTGLKLRGPGEWLAEKHAARAPRSWRKLHIGVDADTGQIIAAELTSKDVDDGSQVGPLLEQIAGPVALFTGDGAYDRDDVYREVCQRHPDAAVIVPPRSSAVPSATAQTAPTKRDRHLQLIAERGRMGWQRASGYNWRALVEADIGRYKRVIGDGRYERRGERTTWRNGYRDRTLDTRLGSLQLRIPKLRQGSYFPPFLEARKSSEKALIAVIQALFTRV